MDQIMEDDQMSPESSVEELPSRPFIAAEDLMTYTIRVPFPTKHYAQSAMNSLGVDPPFMDTKTRKSTIRREMFLEVLDDGITYLNIELTCDKKEVGSLRTSASSMINNLSLICQTMKEFGL